MKAGRKKKYSTEKELKKAIEKYFNSISKTSTVLDEEGNVFLNDNKQPVERIEYILPPTISGLCLSLGIDRSTWQNYCDEKQNPDFKEITTWTKNMMQAFLEEQLLIRKKGLQGIIFNLQNNYGWTDKQEIGFSNNFEVNLEIVGDDTDV